LAGLSKSIGLPQVKLAWIGVGGPERVVEEALVKLEFASDAYLSASTPVQGAAAELLDRGTGVRAQIHARVRSNYRALRRMASTRPALDVLAAEGGWSAVVRVPMFSTEEELVLDLLAGPHVLVHPGYFFDFPREAYLVVSLLISEPRFIEGVGRVIDHLDRLERDGAR
jgi:aspartate/methionine/tyrosine aminotransferase